MFLQQNKAGRTAGTVGGGWGWGGRVGGWKEERRWEGGGGEVPVPAADDALSQKNWGTGLFSQS